MSRQKDSFFRIGLPMLLLVTGGSYILSRLVQGKYDIKVRLESTDQASRFTMMRTMCRVSIMSSAHQSYDCV
jgi:hypothetical protein